MKGMIKRLIFAAIASVLFISCGGGDEFTIKGKLSGIEDGTEITLYRYQGEYYVMAYVDYLKGGKFTFSGPTESDPELLYISANGKGFSNDMLPVVVSRGEKVNITGTDKFTPLWKVNSDIPLQKEEYAYTEKSADLIKRRTESISEEGVIRNELPLSASEEEEENLRKQLDSMLASRRSLEERIAYNDMQILKQTDFSIVWLDHFYKLVNVISRKGASSDIVRELREETLELYKMIPEEYNDDSKVQQINLALFPPGRLKEGESFTDFVLYNLRGEESKISNFTGDKYTLLYFWSFGCDACVSSLEETEKIAEENKNKFVLLGINTDAELTWYLSSTEKCIKFPNYNPIWNTDELMSVYNVTSYPYFVMISPDGTIVKMDHMSVEDAVKSVEGYLK